MPIVYTMGMLVHLIILMKKVGIFCIMMMGQDMTLLPVPHGHV